MTAIKHVRALQRCNARSLNFFVGGVLKDDNSSSLVNGLSDLGPGLIAGAADDDPSGIATYSQAGAQFGFAMLWTVVLTLPLMVAIQLVSARIGFATRKGLVANINAGFPRWVVLAVVGMLAGANILNLAADIAAMAQALRLVIGGSTHVYALTFGLTCLALQVLVPYATYVRWLKWLTLVLLSYVGVALSAELDWADALRATVLPQFHVDRNALLMIVAVFGTTISPYMFFWQAAQEVEEADMRPARTRGDVGRQLRRIKADTIVGMTFSNLIAFFIILSTAATLRAAGLTDIKTSAQAAEALRPIAGPLTFALFSLGIIGTGMLAVPVLAASAAYAVSEAFGWRGTLTARLQCNEGRGFYGVIAVATVGGTLLCFTPFDPVQELFWSAVLNGIIAVPIMSVLMLLAARPETMGRQTISARLRALGWLATLSMAATVAAMLVAVCRGSV